MTFAPDVVAAVLRHMNNDHTADNLDIVRALVDPDAARVEMAYLNDRASIWLYTTAHEGQDPEWQEAVLPWSQRLTERAQIRREVVELHERAVAQLAGGAGTGTDPSAKDQPKG